jgi:hypothetical protein
VVSVLVCIHPHGCGDCECHEIHDDLPHLPGAVGHDTRRLYAFNTSSDIEVQAVEFCYQHASWKSQVLV